MRFSGLFTAFGGVAGAREVGEEAKGVALLIPFFTNLNQIIAAYGVGTPVPLYAAIIWFIPFTLLLLSLTSAPAVPPDTSIFLSVALSELSALSGYSLPF
jgi:hypothetical protein